VLGCLALAGLGAGAAQAHIGSPGATTDGGLRLSFLHRHLDSMSADDPGTLAPTVKGVRRISSLRLKNVEPEKIADVGVSPNGDTAFLSAWGGAVCKYNGIHVVDIADPAKPREVAFIPSKEGSYAGEGIQSLRLTTPAFTGDVVVSNSEICKGRAGFGGINIHDVTRPSSPTPLAVGIGDTTANGQGKKTANQNHSVFAWDAGAKAYLVSVDNEETADVDIFDITNPKQPKLLREYDLAKDFGAIVQPAPGNLVEVFHHDMVVKEVRVRGQLRQVMLISYWDGGYVQLDVTDPRNATLLADTDFRATDDEAPALPDGQAPPPEGNAHQAEFSGDDQYVVAADEDFDPYKYLIRNGAAGTVLFGEPATQTPGLPKDGSISGTSVWAGRACAAADVPPAPPGDHIAVVERGTCDFSTKIASVQQRGGYLGVLVFNREGADGCSTPVRMDATGGIPAFGVASRESGLALFGAAAGYGEQACQDGDVAATMPRALGTAGAPLLIANAFDGWGYVRLFRNDYGTDPKKAPKLQQLGTYQVAAARDKANAVGKGDLSVHEVAFSKRSPHRMYLAYYAAGLRVLEIANGGLAERGRYIAQGGSNLWGVEVFEHGGGEFVAASDRDDGLVVFQYDPAVPAGTPAP
jgi:hypothetical protein